MSGYPTNCQDYESWASQVRSEKSEHWARVNGRMVLVCPVTLEAKSECECEECLK